MVTPRLFNGAGALLIWVRTEQHDASWVWTWTDNPQLNLALKRSLILKCCSLMFSVDLVINTLWDGPFESNHQRKPFWIEAKTEQSEMTVQLTFCRHPGDAPAEFTCRSKGVGPDGSLPVSLVPTYAKFRFFLMTGRPTNRFKSSRHDFSVIPQAPGESCDWRKKSKVILLIWWEETFAVWPAEHLWRLWH